MVMMMMMMMMRVMMMMMMMMRVMRITIAGLFKISNDSSKLFSLFRFSCFLKIIDSRNNVRLNNDVVHLLRSFRRRMIAPH